MNPKHFKTWFISAVVLFSLVMAADYLFLHVLFKGSELEIQESGNDVYFANKDKPSEKLEQIDESFISEPGNNPTSEKSENNFLEALKQCAPDIAAQTVSTPEALVAYLSKSVGAGREIITVENYHLKMTDGAVHRIHVLDIGDTEHNTKEIRYFSLDEEGLPVREYNQEHLGLEKLLQRGTLLRHEQKSELELKDGGKLSLEKHDNKVVELRYFFKGSSLVCAETQCLCNP